MLFWDVLPLPHRCQCLLGWQSWQRAQCSVPVVGSPASSSWHVCVLGTDPLPLPGLWPACHGGLKPLTRLGLLGGMLGSQPDSTLEKPPSQGM